MNLLGAPNDKEPGDVDEEICASNVQYSTYCKLLCSHKLQSSDTCSGDGGTRLSK